MNDELDGIQTELEGDQGKPAAGTSKEKGAGVSETQSLAASLLKEILPTLTKETQKIVKTELQSFKDKRLHQVPEHEDRIGSLEDTTRRLEKHLKAGKDLDEAKNLVKAEVRQEQFFEEFSAIKDRVETMNPGTVQKSLAEREQVVLQSLGLNANDPSVLKLQQSASDAEDYVAKLEQSWWDLKNRPRGTAADIAPSGGGRAPTQETEADLMAKYEAELKALRQSPRAGDPLAVTTIRKKYEELGLAGKI